MAVDTAAKRRAFQAMPWAPVLPFPDGTIDAIDRFSIMGYFGFNVIQPTGYMYADITLIKPYIEFSLSYPTATITIS